MSRSCRTFRATAGSYAEPSTSPARFRARRCRTRLTRSSPRRQTRWFLCSMIRMRAFLQRLPRKRNTCARRCAAKSGHCAPMRWLSGNIFMAGMSNGGSPATTPRAGKPAFRKPGITSSATTCLSAARGIPAIPGRSRCISKPPAAGKKPCCTLRLRRTTGNLSANFISKKTAQQ